jgi:hypothetical protein
MRIPVAERVESPGCRGWSEKEDELFVQPPVSVLDSVLALRLHLDDCKERNGALRVGTRISPIGAFDNRGGGSGKRRARRGLRRNPARWGNADEALLLHASSKVSIDSMRRVLHFVFAPAELPGSLRWPLRGRPMPRCLDGRRRLIEVYLGEVGRSLE